MITDPPTRDGQALAELLDREHLSVPPTMWGYFFPVVIACWRFLHARTPSSVPEVHVQKWDFINPIPSRLTIEGDRYRMDRFISGLPDLPDDPEEPLFIGDHTEVFLELVCADGPILDHVEDISWRYLKGISHDVHLSGMVRKADLPDISLDQCDRLASLLLAGINTSPRNTTA